MAKTVAMVWMGKDGKDGRNGVDGKDGKDGIDGKDGRDGVDGRSRPPLRCRGLRANFISVLATTIPRMVIRVISSPYGGHVQVNNVENVFIYPAEYVSR